MAKEKEREIPVLTVWKNNAILKNIFLINSPPQTDHQTNDEELEETLLVGRHPESDIRLEHPSISRFHLRIHSIPTLRLLYLTDLSSVHGTWVSGNKIEPNIRTILKEGDTLRIGGSSRVYKLHWIPLSQAYDVSKPFVPPLDFSEPQDDEEENIEGLESLVLCDHDDMAVAKEVLEEPLLQPEPVLVKDEDNELVPLTFEGLESLFLDENSQVLEQKQEPQTPVIPDDKFENEDAQSSDSILEGLVPLFMGENWEWVGLEDVYLSCPTEEEPLESFQPKDAAFVGSFLEELDGLSLDKNSEFLAGEVIPSAPPMPDNTLDGCDLESEITQGNLKKSSLHQEDIQNGAWKFWYGSPLAPSYRTIAEALPNTDSEPGVFSEKEFLGSIGVPQTSSAEDHNESQLWSFWSGKMGVESVCSYLSDAEPFSESEKGSLRNGYQSSPLTSVKGQFGSTLLTSGEKSALSKRFSRRELESICSSLSDAESLSELENLSELDDRSSLTTFLSPQPLSSVKNQIKSPSMISEQKSENIWSRRGKLESAPQILTCKTDGKKVKTDQKIVKPEPISRALFHGLDNQEEEEKEIFTPDKENLTPNTHKSLRKKAMLKEVKNATSGTSLLLKTTCSSNNYYEDAMPASPDKENFSPKILLKQKTARRASPTNAQSVRLKERKGDRMPFQSLLADSPQKSITKGNMPDAAMTSGYSVNSASPNKAQSVRLRERKGDRMPFQSLLPDSPQKSIFEGHMTDATMTSGYSVNCAKPTCKGMGAGDRIRQWNMVVDTTTLLNKESRKALQLLEGLKGTQLIIPRIVIRELGCLKRQTSFFRRNTEVSSALEWIEDCMVKTQWWIHVQNSMEEGRPVAPTPPASPLSQLSCGTICSYAFSALEPWNGLLSPTVEDDVLDYALCFRKNNNDGQLVLLSNDVTLKIKAMAEGIICETAEEFRGSLVNPYSERFLWTDSSPRGQTWSCADDLVLRQNLYPSSLKMTPKSMENVKGLKLILLHNSRYYERMTTVC